MTGLRWVVALYLGMFACGTWACGDDDATAMDGDGGSDGGGQKQVDGGTSDAAIDASSSDAGGETDGGMDAGETMDAEVPTDAATEDAGDAAADAGPPYDDPTGHSGTRLRRRYFDGGGGAFMTLDLWDSELEQACWYDTAPDGQLRCLPKLMTSVYYSDDLCTNPIVVASENRCDALYARNSNGTRLYRRTDTPAVISDFMAYYQDGSNCVGFFSSSDEYWVAEEVPSNTFVRGQVDAEARSDNLVTRFIDGDDGSRILFETLDQLRGTSCDLEHVPGRCLPSRRARIQHFSDASCNTPVAATNEDFTPGLLYTQQFEDGCVSSETYYAVGSELNLATRYVRNSSDMCVTSTFSSSTTHWAQGSMLALTSFPPTSQQQVGDGRLQSRRRVDADDEPLAFAHVFWDTQIDRECAAHLFPDGSYRCVPTDSGLVSYDYADASCTDAPLGWFSCATPGAWLIRRDSLVSTCDPSGALIITNVYARGAHHESSTYYSTASGSCTVETSSGSLVFFALGAEAEASDFPELRLEIE